MARHLRRIPVIQGRAAYRLVRKRETAGLNDVHADVQAGAETKGRAKVLRNVRLKKRQQHSKRSTHGFGGGKDESTDVGSQGAAPSFPSTWLAPASSSEGPLPEPLVGSKT